MTKKLFLTGMLGLVLAFGIVFVGCDNPSSGNDSKDKEEEKTPPIANTNIESENLGELVQIKAGSVLMGGSFNATLSKDFYMGEYEVTQAQWIEIMGYNPSKFDYYVSLPTAGEVLENAPVEHVSWYAAIAFCNTVSIMEGLTPAYTILGSTNPEEWGSIPTSANADWTAVTCNFSANGYRLPTEVEWEYACRAGTTTVYNTGDEISDDTGWYSENSTVPPLGIRTHEVGKKPANAWGLYDMHGNVGEWCWDWYGTYPAEAQTNYTGPDVADRQVTKMSRGGSFQVGAAYVTSGYRDHGALHLTDAGNKDPRRGFRVVRTAE